MKDIGETPFVIGIEIHKDRFERSLRLSQKVYIEKVLERYRMNDCTSSIELIVKGDKFSQNYYALNELKK